MLVIDLIIKLQQLNPNLKVMVDITKEGAECFNFISLADADEVVTNMDERLCLLCTETPTFKEPNLN